MLSIYRKSSLILIISLLILSGCTKEELKEQETFSTTVENEYETDVEKAYGQRFINNNSNTQSVLAFECCKSYNDGTEGGSSSQQYSVAIKENVMTIYCTHHDTTASNGITIKYEININSLDINTLDKYITNENWEILHDEITRYINTTENGVIVSGGMTDKSSRNEDGSYIWETEFHSMIE